MGRGSKNIIAHGTKSSPQLAMSNLFQKQSLITTLPTKREKLLESANTSEVKKIINELYRPGSSIGDGGTADAIRKEIKTGKPIGGHYHTIKGKERLKQIKKIISLNPHHEDIILLMKLKEDLEDALKGVK